METLYIIFCLICFAVTGLVTVKYLKKISDQEANIRRITDERNAFEIQKEQCERKIIQLSKENKLQNEIINDFAAEYESKQKKKK